MARTYRAWIAGRQIEVNDNEPAFEQAVKEAWAALEREVVDLRRGRELLLDQIKASQSERDSARGRVVELESELAKLRATPPRSRGAQPE
jgi:hypothetical protein